MEKLKEHDILGQIYRRWWIYLWVENILMALALTILVASMLQFIFQYDSTFGFAIASICFALLLCLTILGSKIFRFNRQYVASYLNANYPEMEESTELLSDKHQATSILVTLQKDRVSAKLKAIYPGIKIPHHLPQIILFLLVITLHSFLIGRVDMSHLQQENGQEIRAVAFDAKETAYRTPTLDTVSVGITPPGYTRLEITKTENLDISAIVGSLVSWHFQFSDSIVTSFLSFGYEDTIFLQSKGSNTYFGSKKVRFPGFYTIGYVDIHGKSHTSKYFVLEILEDEKPKVEIIGREQYTVMMYDLDAVLDVRVEVQDDFGITASYLVATVAKGSGESVKFREEKFVFPVPDYHPTVQKHVKRFNLQQLGMAPGDELYFYLEAFDNRHPERQRNRTEMYFLALEDTAYQTLSVSAGLGVDKVPEYFRSQRQIIIDTERLIRERKDLPAKKFHERSNNLGADQKILRLRYGQFLGEEFESDMAHGGKENGKGAPEGGDAEEDHHPDDGHDHSNDAMDATVGRIGDVGPELEAYTHQHNISEEATFFDEALKAKLKAALAQMWEAELKLRLHQPEDALPFEYKALKLIKEIQQQSRVYVDKVGFEPPPLKPLETRFTGDLDEITSKSETKFVPPVDPYPNIQSAIVLLEALKLAQRPLRVHERELLARAGKELADGVAIRPSIGLQSLNVLKIFIEQEGLPQNRRQGIEAILDGFFKIMPTKRPRPEKLSTERTALSELFIMEAGGIK